MLCVSRGRGVGWGDTEKDCENLSVGVWVGICKCKCVCVGHTRMTIIFTVSCMDTSHATASMGTYPHGAAEGSDSIGKEGVSGGGSKEGRGSGRGCMIASAAEGTEECQGGGYGIALWGGRGRFREDEMGREHKATNSHVRIICASRASIVSYDMR